MKSSARPLFLPLNSTVKYGLQSAEELAAWPLAVVLAPSEAVFRTLGLDKVGFYTAGWYTGANALITYVLLIVRQPLIISRT
jgi:hypothetical protein